MTGPASFRFLSEQASLNEAGWDDPAHDKLWRYNLHYFDDLNAADASKRADWHSALIQRWIIEKRTRPRHRAGSPIPLRFAS